MNERIKELSRKAVISMRAEKTDLPPLEENVIKKILELREEYDEKFAELIIKNCADIADEMEAIRCPYPGDAIVESFGLGEDVGAANWRAKD